MPKIEKYEPGSFCWVELAAAELRPAVEFYQALFGWTTREMPMGEGPDDVYVMMLHDGVEAAAIFKKMDPAPPRWGSYIAVESADAAAEKAASLGATVIAPPFDVFTAGRMSWFSDPQGAAFAVWQAKDHIGSRVRDEVNTLCWNELWTTNIESARAFYQSLFGWSLKVSPEYTEIHLGDRGIGGMMQAPMPGVPSMWYPYFMVEDTDATTAKAKSLGSTVHVEPRDIPTVGRFAVIADPQGAIFSPITLAPR